jgi:hypothetical protein
LEFLKGKSAIAIARLSGKERSFSGEQAGGGKPVGDFHDYETWTLQNARIETLGSPESKRAYELAVDDFVGRSVRSQQ